MQSKKLRKKPAVTVENALNDRRIATLFGEVNHENTSKLIKELIKLDHVSEKPITMLINSPGGYCSDGLAIIDVMRGCRSAINTVIIGDACSMAAVISICGDYRAITENGFWMSHPMAGGSYDYQQFVLDRAKYMERLNEKIENILREQTKLTQDDVFKYTHGELWLDAQQAFEKCVVDEVMGAKNVKVRVSYRRIRERGKKK